MLVLALLSACRDFAIPEVPPDVYLQNLTVQPLRVGPGGSLRITFRAPGGGTALVTVNGLPAEPVSAEGVDQEWRYRPRADEAGVLNVVATLTFGGEQTSSSVQAFLDAQAPAAPVLGLLVVDALPPGQDDRLHGAPGCVASSDARRVELALDPVGRIVVGEAAVAADGSFPSFELGDNVVSRLFVVALDEAGNRSPPTAVDNDVEGPRLTIVESSPRAPRSGAPFTLVLRSDEPLPAAPKVTLSAGSAEAALEVQGTGTAWRATLAKVDLPVGPATLALESVDAAGNARHEKTDLEVAPALHLDVARLRLSRGSSGWAVWGTPGAAPFPAQVEASVVQGGTQRLSGTRLVASDGSFDPVAVGASLAAADRVRLEAFDDAGAVLDSVELAPDLTPPVIARVVLAPAVIGPSVPAQITVEASEPLGPGTTVAVGGLLAQRVAGPETSQAAFTYAVTGNEPDGAVKVTPVDQSGNAGAVWSGALNLDLKGPTVGFVSSGAPWAPPTDPPMSYQPPDTVELRVEDAAAGVGPVRYSVVDVRTGASWDGATWVPGPPVEHAALPVQPLSLKDLIAADQRVEFRVYAEDKVGNRSSLQLAVSRYADARWIQLYPALGAASARMTGQSLVVLSERRLCAVATVCRQGESCLEPLASGRLVSLYSPDGGTTWTERDLGVEVTAGMPWVWRLAYDEAGVHGLVSGEGVFLRLGPDCVPAVPGAAPHPFARTVVWDGLTAWAATPGGLFRSTDTGFSWERADVGTDVGFFDLSVGPAGTLLASGQASAVVHSSDGGANWTARQLSPSVDLTAALVMPDGSFYVGGSKLFRKSSSGQVWTDVPMAPLTDFSIKQLRRTRLGPLYWVSSGMWNEWVYLSPGRPGAFRARDEALWDVWDLDGWGLLGIGGGVGWVGDDFVAQGWLLYSPSGGGWTPDD